MIWDALYFCLSVRLYLSVRSVVTLQWRHNGCDGVSNHQSHDCLLNCLFRRRSKKTSKLRVTGLCAGNSPVTGIFSVRKGRWSNPWSIMIFSDISPAILNHDDVIKWKHFPHYWPFVRGIHWSPVNSPHNGHWHGALMFSLICAWLNGWVNNREAGDLRHHRAHYHVAVMTISSDQQILLEIVKNPKNFRNAVSGCSVLCLLWPLLLTWSNFTPGMDK